MDNFIPKGTGNSRLMKSSIPANTTLEQLITMLRSGTFPYDIGEVNDEGVIERGTPLNKGTLLKDGTSDSLGIARSSVPDDALQKLSAASLYGVANGYITLGQLDDGDIFTYEYSDVEQDFVRVSQSGDNVTIKQMASPQTELTLPADTEITSEPVNVLRTTLGELLAVSASQIVGGARVKCGTYVGNGTAGVGNETTIDLGFQPKFVIVTSGNLRTTSDGQWWRGFLWTRGSALIDAAGVTYGGAEHFTESKTGLSWYATGQSVTADLADVQQNTNGTTYYYLAIGGGLGSDGDTPSLIPPDITIPQEFSDPQKETARDNIGAASTEMVLATFPRKTLASATIHTFSDGADNIPIKAMEVAVRAVQDLHGQTSPYPAGGGKNKWSLGDLTESSQSGVAISLAAGTYTIQAVRSSAALNLALRFNYSGGSSVVVSLLNSTDFTGKTFTLAEDVVSLNYNIANYSSGASITKVQIESGSTATAWLPYENLCPISGWTQASIPTSGKNMLDNKRGSSATTINGVTFTPQSDGSVIVNGTASGGAAIYTMWNRGTDNVRLPAGTYTLSGCPSGGTTGTYFMQWQCTRDGALAGYGNDTGNGLTATTRDGDIQQVTIRVANGATANNLRFYPQLELGSTKTAYEPYRGQTAIIDFGGTVYGGQLTYNGGLAWEFTAEYGIVKGTASNITRQSEKQWVINHTQIPLALIPTGNIGLMSDTFAPAPNNPETGKCLLNVYGAIRFTTESDYAYASALVSAIGEPSFVYPLANPQTVTLTASAEVVTEYGDNVLFCSCGDSSLTYRQDIGLVIGG